MGILKALGLGLTILILRSLLPDVFQAIEITLLQFFSLTGSIFDKAQIILNHAPISL
jgi:hypothetical protein